MYSSASEQGTRMATPANPPRGNPPVLPRQAQLAPDSNPTAELILVPNCPAYNVRFSRRFPGFPALTTGSHGDNRPISYLAAVRRGALSRGLRSFPRAGPAQDLAWPAGSHGRGQTSLRPGCSPAGCLAAVPRVARGSQGTTSPIGSGPDAGQLPQSVRGVEVSESMR